MAPQQADLGQHLLHDPRAIARVLDAADLRPGETVLDAGAGAGALTVPSAAAVGPTGQVIALDIDPAMLDALRDGAPSHVNVVEADLLEYPLPQGLDVVVANPPFKIAAPLIEKIAAATVPRAILVLPRELIERLTAPPDSERYGKLTIKITLRADIEDLGTLSRHAFAPPPEIPCGLLRMRARKDALPVDDIMLEQVYETARASWDRKAKRTFGPLAERLRADSAGLTRLLVDAGWADARTRALPPDAFGAIARYLSEHGRVKK